MGDSFRGIALACTLVYLLFLILRTAVFTVTGIETIRYALLFLVISAWSLRIYYSSNICSLDRFHWCTIGLFGWAMLSILWTMDLARTFDRIPSYFLVVLVLLLIWDTMRTERHVYYGIQTFVFGAAVLCLITLANAVMGVQYLPGRYSGGGFNPNVLATPVVLAIPLAWYLSFVEVGQLRARVVRIVNLGYVPISLLVIVLTASRQAMVASTIAVSYVAWDMQREYRFLSPGRIAFLLILVSGVALLGAPERVVARVASIPQEVLAGDLGTRLRQWSAGYRLFVDRPFTGIGSGAFRTTIDTLIGYEVAPDNTYLTVLYELGLVGAAFFAVVVLRSIGVIKHFGDMRKREMWLSCLGMLTLLWLVNDWFASPTVWILIGLLVTHARETASSTGPPTAPSTVN